MNINELNKKIEALKKDIFYLEMKDRWSTEDYERSRKMHNELLQLEHKRAAQ